MNKFNLIYHHFECFFYQSRTLYLRYRGDLENLLLPLQFYDNIHCNYKYQCSVGSRCRWSWRDLSADMWQCSGRVGLHKGWSRTLAPRVSSPPSSPSPLPTPPLFSLPSVVWCSLTIPCLSRYSLSPCEFLNS